MQLLSRLATFPGGTHPPEYKHQTASKKSTRIPLPEKLFLSLQQHTGAAAKPLVGKGDEVLRGQMIAEAESNISASLHAPASGTVNKIGKHPLPDGTTGDCIIIEVDQDNEDEKFYSPFQKIDSISSEQIYRRVREAGVVGLGGGAFPSHVKLSPPEETNIDTVILNGCECESFLTSDHRTMLERPKAVVNGLRLIMKAVGAEQGIIGVEDNKPDAVEELDDSLPESENLTVQAVEDKYPQGVENMLIYALTGRKMGASLLPADVGCVVNNVSTAAAISDAVLRGKPLIERIITVAGPAVKSAANYTVPIGTPFEHLFEHCGLIDETKLILDGGAMMGTSQSDLSVPTVKATGGIVALNQQHVNERQEHPCIRCARCVSKCPQKLVPTRLARLVKARRYDEAKDLHVQNCLECGVCSYVCPSNIPLVHWLRVGKEKVCP